MQSINTVNTKSNLARYPAYVVLTTAVRELCLHYKYRSG